MLSGKLNPYTEGTLGVITEGAYADLLLVEGNPIEDATVLVGYEKNIELVMKNSVIYWWSRHRGLVTAAT